jgi:ADP-ribose pyrophosphatase YjhB (NUDIX family)
VTACTAAAEVVVAPLQQIHGVVVPVSSSSSTCTRESDNNLSDAEGGIGGGQVQLIADASSALTATNVNGDRSHAAGIGCLGIIHNTTGNNARQESGQDQQQKREVDEQGGGASDRWNAKVRLLKTSRQGRTSQRWLSDGQTGEAVRLVTGCVPVLRSGKILFISSSRQSEWILPKGGWEQDEAMEESAVRECFEEAGVLGSLGPPLSEVQYETRKAKKRRLEQQQLQQLLPTEDVRTKDPKTEATASPLSYGAGVSTAPTILPLPPPPSAGPPREFPQALASPHSLPSPAPLKASPDATEAAASASSTPTTPHLDLARIRWLAQQNAPRGASDDTASVASNFSSCTHQTNGNSNQHTQVRMTLFPLYVTDVHEDWPERGRLRTAVDIDQAIAMMDARPEFRAALEEVKARGLHLVHPSPGNEKEPPRQGQEEEATQVS